ncbi:allophanate hydrolase subunit 1 [Psychrobacter sp. YP14]|jgi:KipI family sensor histidine kinase inhibitor|uniref:5-oxoprolinase subunit PxpB n=2 Tax=Psychrobacter TaxID=497 RepID=A0A844M1A1_9GAMM|nr:MULTISPECIES: 5-oxoprolinase subunit PxpB [Psychrobacter]AWT49922.1 allophanate hydrolase subunit 1 [Psychrobacter sp. YP14]MUG32726.1 5-oxoprolinase subunit PxpB [Psychrobacter sanguinis]
MPNLISNAELNSPDQPTWQLCSETNLTLHFAKPITLQKQQLCWALADRIRKLLTVTEVVIGMNTLSVFTQPLTFIELNELKQHLTQLIKQTEGQSIQGKHIQIPVQYGGEYGPDLKPMAQALGLSVEEVVKLHSEAIYTVYFIGFQPGFPYLGGLSEKLYFPRRETPRTQVPAGSVGIGGEQTGVYPFSSPGGWQLLGRTQMPLFDLTQNPPTALSAGDTLQFTVLDIHYS